MADLKIIFSKGDTTKWSYKLYEITEDNNDTIPNYHIAIVGKAGSLQREQIPERDTEA